MSLVNASRAVVTPEPDAAAIVGSVQEIERRIGQLIVGQGGLVRRLVIALFAAVPYSYEREDGFGCAHVLLEGVPGVAKTLTVTTLARLIAAKFQRIQLTPDMLPADIVGTRVYHADTGTFGVERGPIFTNILLADEINRATPKTQSALLEAMQERQVTLGDATYPLEDPFWVLATQNPIEQEGVYSLPEAQLDRFSMMIRVGYPEAADELKMLQVQYTPALAQPLLHPADVVSIRRLILRSVYVDDRIREYVVRLGRATRRPADAGRADLGEYVQVGVSPRSYQHIIALSRVAALLDGRDFVLPDDVKLVLADAYRHRIVRSLRAQAEGVDADTILAGLAASVRIP